jgi:hypothetical protein
MSQICRIKISDEGDERLSLSHAVDKKEISTDILLEGDGERGGKSTKLSILMGLLPSVTNLSNKVDHPFQKPSQNGLNGKFMSVDKVFQSAQRQKPIGQYIPRGYL